jgi:uncharacterized membrane protein (UPF0127 family)
MLFDFSPEQQVSMWMRNTIYRSMILIRADGCNPDRREYRSRCRQKSFPGGPAGAVLEVIAGTAQKYGIKPGDRVAHPLFNGR